MVRYGGTCTDGMCSWNPTVIGLRVPVRLSVYRVLGTQLLACLDSVRNLACSDWGGIVLQLYLLIHWSEVLSCLECSDEDFGCLLL